MQRFSVCLVRIVYIDAPQMLSWERSLAVWQGFYFCGHIAMILIWIVGTYFVKPPKSADSKATANGKPAVKKDL